MRRVNVNLANLTTAQTNGTDSFVHGPGCVVWHSTYETTGSATASYELLDGPSRSGNLLMYVTLSAGQSTRDSAVLHAIPFVESVHLNIVSGAVGGVIICWADHVCEEVLDHEVMLRRLQAVTDLSLLNG